MKFIDWFAGIGGFRRGMELAGHECVGFCEFDKYAVMSYTAMHLCTQEQLDYLATLPLKQRQKEILKDEYKNGEWYANDVRRVDARDIPEADCWCFGFPCQDISVAGKQAGFNGTRSSLFFEVMRLLDERKANGFSCPGYLFIENVKNLLSINRGIDFAKVLFALDERGFDSEWQVLNSKNFNVPQNRERVFIIGHLRSGCTAEVFPVEGTDGENCVCGIGHRNGYRRNTQIFDRGGITEALDTAQGGGRGHHTIEVIGKAYDRDNYGDNRNRVLGEGGVLSEPDGNAVQRTLQNRVITVGNTNPSGKGMNGNCYSSDGINPTLTCNKNEGNRVAIPAADIDTNHLYNQRGTVHDVNGIARTLVGCNQHSGSGNEPKVAIPVLTPDRANKRQNGRRFKEDGEEAFSLTTQDRHGVAVNVTGYNATLKKGRGGVQTAIQLCARDAKGPSTTNQPMTLAAYLLSTKESDQKNEQKPTALPPEKTEDSADTNRKEP